MVRPLRLDFADAAELVAFVESIGGVKKGRWVFHWKGAGTRDYAILQKHMLGFERVKEMIDENLAEPTREDGLCVLRAMRDGGWCKGSVPPVVRLAMLDMRDSGMSQQLIADQLGLTRDQVRTMANGPRWGRRAAGLRAGDLVAF